MLDRWQKIAEKIIFQGQYKTIVQKDFQVGDDSKTFHFEIERGSVSASVLALTVDKQVIVERQFRTGPEKVLYELPAGIVEEGETPLEGMARELAEETGYTGNLEFVAQAYPSAYSNAIEHIFAAKNCKKTAELFFDEGEFVETVLMSVDEFRGLLKAGKILNSHTGYLGLDYLGLL